MKKVYLTIQLNVIVNCDEFDMEQFEDIIEIDIVPYHEDYDIHDVTIENIKINDSK